MDTRRRAAPVRPAVCDEKLRKSTRAGVKEANLVLLSSSPASHRASVAATAFASEPITASSSSAKPGRDTPFSNAQAFCRSVADARMSGTGSETSRSSTPVTDLSSWCPSTGSSFAMSVQPENECSHQQDDGFGSSNGKWDHESFYEQDEDAQSIRSEDMAAAGDAVSTAQTVRHSWQRQSISSQSDASRLSMSDMSDNEVLEDDDYEAVDEDEDEDNNDSGRDNDSLDIAIVEAVDGNLGLAATIIPLIFNNLRAAARRKVENWQLGTGPFLTPSSSTERTVAAGKGKSSGGGGSTSSGTGGSSSRHRGNSSSDQRKRRCLSNSDEEGREAEDDQDGGGNSGMPHVEAAADMSMLLLACPFHKLNPIKYGIQHNMTYRSQKDTYRACAGPGFKSIQRLKEHLKRKHTPVQCDRCFRVFSGSEKPKCMTALSEHRRREVPCERGDPALREGIDEAQWAALDKQNRRKNQEKHKVEKWFEMWRVLFPEVPQPNTPWYHDAVPTRMAVPSEESEAFGNLFVHILNHKVNQGDISFPGDDIEDMKQRLRNTVQQTFRTYVSIHSIRSPTTDTSSSHTGTHNLQPSLLGGSSTHPSGFDGLSQPLTDTTYASGALMAQSPVHQPPHYTLSMPGSATGISTGGAMSYIVPPMPMGGQRGHPAAVYHAAPTSTPVMPAQAPTSMGPPMGATSFAGMSQEDLSSYYGMPMMGWQTTGMPYATHTMPTTGYDPTTGHALQQTDFYTQPREFMPGQEQLEYANLE